MIKIGTPKTSSGMGDVLLLTAVCKHIPNSTVELFPQAEKFKIFFDHLCNNVNITENAFVTPDIPPGHFSQQKLRFYGFDNVCYLPFIYPQKKYIEKGKKITEKYENPIAFIANCAKHNSIRDPHKNYFQPILDKLSEKHTILQFGLSNNFTEYKKTIPIVDCSIEELICYYISIKKFIGVDTGDAHLMIAVGGSCDIFIPTNQYIRNSIWWNYNNYSHIKYHYFS